MTQFKPVVERVQALTDISRSGYVVIATKPVHRLQIRPIAHNQSAPPIIPPTYIRVRAVLCECGEGQTDTQTRVTNIHCGSATPRAKCNNRHIPTVHRPRFFCWQAIWPRPLGSCRPLVYTRRRSVSTGAARADGRVYVIRQSLSVARESLIGLFYRLGGCF